MTVDHRLSKLVNTALSPLGLELHRTALKAEGFPFYVQEANKAGMDVNEWIEQKLGWDDSLPVLEELVFPLIQSNSVVCELGVGTGRFSRHLTDRLSEGELHLVDYSPWLVDFLRTYFRRNPGVHVHLNDGCSIPISDGDWADLVFSAGTFIDLKLGAFYLYSREFFRVLKPGGYCVVGYHDITTSDGWLHLVNSSKQYWETFAYHNPETVDKVFTSAGFDVIRLHHLGKDAYLTVRKPA